MTVDVYIETLRLCPLRPPWALPRVASRLVELIQDHGVIEPVVVREVRSGEFEILGNVEVWMAAQRAQLERVPIHVLTGVTDDDAVKIIKAESTGYAIDPIDEAEYLHEQLERIGPGEGRLAKLAYLTGHRRPYISHALRLLKLPLAVQEMVRRGQLSAGHARALVTLELRSAQLALAKRAVAQKLSVRQIESIARELRSGAAVLQRSGGPPSGQDKDPNTRRLESHLSDALGCRATIDTKDRNLTISYHNLDILEGILEKLGVTNV